MWFECVKEEYVDIIYMVYICICSMFVCNVYETKRRNGYNVENGDMLPT